jgi:predicted P-loop ATPase
LKLLGEQRKANAQQYPTNMNQNITLSVAASQLSEVSEAIALPTLWVADAFKAGHLAQLFQVREYSQVKGEIEAGEHYILFDSEISEAVVKGIAWRIRAAGGNCYLHGIRSSLENLANDRATARELTISIFEFAQPYENWLIRQEEQPLTTRVASEVAKVAIALLSEPERSIELGAIGERCKQSSYSWSKIVSNLEQEFKKELSRRPREIQSPVGLLGEDSVSPARSKTKQMYNLLVAEWGEHLRFNTMTLKPELEGKPLDMDTLAVRLGRDFDIDIGNEKAGQTAVFIAKERSYSPVQEYLERVAGEYSSEDLSPLDDIATRYFGSNEPLHNVFMRKHLIGLVKRVFEPGCQHDTAVILQGSQGKQKSNFWRTLAVNPEWFDDTITSGNNDKDERLKLRRFWILELAELESVFKRKEIASLRGFLTTKSDNLRVPYGRSIESFPRTSGFVGSVNPAQFLVDPEGHRRYWIISVLVDLIPVEKLVEERDRLWAAAVHAYRNGEQSWLTRSEEKRNALLNQRHEIEDSWEEAIDAFLEYQSETTVSEILSNCLKIELGRHERVLQMRVAECLKRLGWVKSEKKKASGKVFQLWRWQPDEAEVATGVATGVATDSNPGTASDIAQDINNSLSKVATKVATDSNPDTAGITEERLLPLTVFPEIFETHCKNLDYVSDLKNSEKGSNPSDLLAQLQSPQGLDPVATPVATFEEKGSTFKVGDEVEFFCESDKQWHTGRIASIETQSGYFIKAVIRYWAFNKSRQHSVYRSDWLAAR